MLNEQWCVNSEKLGLLNSDENVQECEARMYHSSNEIWLQKISQVIIIDKLWVAAKSISMTLV